MAACSPRTSAARFERMEGNMAKLAVDAEKAVDFSDRTQGWVEKMDDKVQRLGISVARLEDSRANAEAVVTRTESDFGKVRDQLETASTRVANFEFRLTAFDVRLCSLEPLGDLNVKVCSIEPRLAKLEQLEPSFTRLEPAVQELAARFSGCEARCSSLEVASQNINASTENLHSDHKASVRGGCCAVTVPFCSVLCRSVPRAVWRHDPSDPSKLLSTSNFACQNHSSGHFS